MDADTAILETEEGMKKAVGHMVQEFAGVRTGKASPTLVEGIDIHVASYGSSMKLKQLAMITTPEPRLIVVQPFDPSTTQDIERGLKESKLGINPNVDGKNIRLPIPERAGRREPNWQRGPRSQRQRQGRDHGPAIKCGRDPPEEIVQILFLSKFHAKLVRRLSRE